MKRLGMLALTLLLFIGLALTSTVLAQENNETEGEQHEEEIHHEEHHDPWMNISIVGIAIIVFAVVIVVWPRK